MKSYKNQNIFAMGRSIGSGGATYLANKRRVQGLILISPFSTIEKVGKDIICIGGIVKNHFNNEE